jgi:ribulose-phosphate 3-epimerase
LGYTLEAVHHFDEVVCYRRHFPQQNLPPRAENDRPNVYRNNSVQILLSLLVFSVSQACRMGISPLLAHLNDSLPLIGPSLLASDFANLQSEIRRLEEAGARILHLDIMDGHFVPNLSFGIPVVKAVRRVTDLPLDVHLMISRPELFVKPFREAGADLLTFHVEAVADPLPLIESIRELGAGVGMALNPPTPVETLEPYLDRCDLILAMSVMPGFGGQEFDPVALEKLRWLRPRVAPDVLLSIDGGVNLETIGQCAQAGANLLVTGTALLKSADYRKCFAELRTAAQ